MKQNWLTEMNTRMKESKDKELDHILSLLRPKAVIDRGITDALNPLVGTRSISWITSRSNGGQGISGRNHSMQFHDYRPVGP